MGKIISEMKHEYNNAFDKLLVDADRGALGDKLSPFMTRPAYAHTSMEQKKLWECKLQCVYEIL